MSDIKKTQTLPHLNTLIGVYGYNYNHTGILSEHLHRVDVTISVPAHGRPLAVAPDGTTAKILCPELIEIPTEDGPVSGRCGERVERKDDFACPGHQRLIDSYRAMNDFEQWQAEREDEERYAHA